ncbi:Type 1 glutamine amidotransferase-like domain-containing protein [Streptomyces sp. NPDC001255]|uniref:Type 1 glutamine amidotransferase-like domain-containing protein n=1 Tax=Streptomyces sp. NPDC001255 TaxID=3364550 RepID=UPI00367CBABB
MHAGPRAGPPLGGGGSTANLLAVRRARGVGQLIREAAERGALLCGISAGANCWAVASLTDSYGPLAVLAEGLGLLPGSVLPERNAWASARTQCPGPRVLGLRPRPRSSNAGGADFPAPYTIPCRK